MPRAFGLKSKLQFTYVLDIDAAVGKNCTNRPEDVRLVQYLLAVWLAHEKDTQKLVSLLRESQPMVVDGTFGKNSIAVLEVFENFHQPTVKKDGRVDPLFTSLGAKKMFLLNQILFFAGGLRGGVPETRVPFPQSLINHLYR